MTNDKDSTPRRYLGVMVSSTFTDLEKHRLVLIKAIKGQGLTDVAMENDSAKADLDVIDSSLEMVRDASAYIAIVSHKYGQTPTSPDRNPNQLSITELEFNEAQRLSRPILLFIMGDEHPVRKVDVETDPLKREKLNAFRERAKQMKSDSKVHRVYATFDSLEEFSSKAIHAVANLRRYLDDQNNPATHQPSGALVVEGEEPTLIPTPPAFYAEPPYIGSHTFVGRQAQLDLLSDWALPADPHPILMFDAIGGSGKSMLTWEWTTKHATKIREDWAGCVWYSFYERGAVMADFCRRSLAYMTGKPLGKFAKMKTLELSELLLFHLQTRPWLLVLDGLERVLVAYHRLDAAQVPDEIVNSPTDQISHRDPCAAIRPEEDDLLRTLTVAAPSKLLITSRLIPRVLLNLANQPLPGVRRESLAGLLPGDAEALLRSCQVTGDSRSIQNYLKSHCDCHPLVTGILAGLINDYLPNKGNFDSWVADPAGGDQLNLVNLDLVQKRNHILKAALNALPEKSRQLLSVLALLSEAADYPLLSALNPHLPLKPKEVPVPKNPRTLHEWEELSEDIKMGMEEHYQAALQSRKEYDLAIKAWHSSSVSASQELANTIKDLERRGLLQYDKHVRKYDLHPVVRGISAGQLRPEETSRYGQRVVDYFSQKAQNPYEQAETLEDVQESLQIIRTLLKMNKYEKAYDVLVGDLSFALINNLEAHAEILSLLRPFFPTGWANLPENIEGITLSAARDLAGLAAATLHNSEAFDEALTLKSKILLSRVQGQLWGLVCGSLNSISISLRDQKYFGKNDYCCRLALDLATLLDDKNKLFDSRIRFYSQLVTIGKWEDAQNVWLLLDWSVAEQDKYALGYEGERFNGLFHLWHGDLTEEHFVSMEEHAKLRKDRSARRFIHSLRGQWYIEQDQWLRAAEELHEAVRMSRIIGMNANEEEIQLALAEFRLGQLIDPRQTSEQLGQARKPFHRGLAELWLAIGDYEHAKKHALSAYELAWADGEPYVFRYELNKTIVLLEKLGVEIPKLPSYDPTKFEKYAWEDEVAAAIEKLRLEKNDKKTLKTNS